MIFLLLIQIINEVKMKNLAIIINNSMYYYNYRMSGNAINIS